MEREAASSEAGIELAACTPAGSIGHYRQVPLSLLILPTPTFALVVNDNASNMVAGGLTGTITLVLLLLALPLLWYLIVTAHELGHLLGGWLAGFRLVKFEIGPVKLVHTEQGVQVAWKWERWMPQGMVLMVPVGNQALPRRWAIMIAGGIVAHLLLLFLAVIVSSVPVVPLAVRVLAGIVMVITLWFILSTILPTRNHAGYSTDGTKLLILLRGGPGAERQCAILAIIAAFTGTQRPATWDQGLLDRAVALPDGSEEDVYANLLYYTHHVDLGEVQLAEPYLAYALANATGCSPTLQSQLFFTAAQHEAHFRQNPGNAQVWLERIPDPSLVGMEPADRLAGEAGIRLAEGRYGEARRIALEGIMAAERSPYRGLAAVQIEQLQDIIDAADQAITEAGMGDSWRDRNRH